MLLENKAPGIALTRGGRRAAYFSVAHTVLQPAISRLGESRFELAGGDVAPDAVADVYVCAATARVLAGATRAVVHAREIQLAGPLVVVDSIEVDLDEPLEQLLAPPPRVFPEPERPTVEAAHVVEPDGRTPEQVYADALAKVTEEAGPRVAAAAEALYEQALRAGYVAPAPVAATSQ